jgi:lipopolysaccharide export system protein LptA
MRRIHLLALAVLLLGATVAWAATAPPAAKTTLGTITIWSSGPVEGALRGTLEFTKGVTVTSQGMKLTCDTLKVWPAKSGKSFDRIDASGNVHVTGLYTASDKTKWEVDARAQSATFSSRTRIGTLTGEVNLHAVNAVDKSAFTGKADTFTYNLQTERWRMDRAGQPVEMQFEPAPVSVGGSAAK